MSATATAKSQTPPTAAPADRRLFDVHAAAEYLVSIGAVGTGVHAIRGLIARGEVPHVRLGKKFFVTREALDTWITRNERRAR